MGWSATPSFAEAGGIYQSKTGRVWQHGLEQVGGTQAVPGHLRPALAALYCADITAELVESLATAGATSAPVVVEGPLARNVVFYTALSAWLVGRRVLRSTDSLEGTARGAWMLADWPERARLSSWYEPIPIPASALQLELAKYRTTRRMDEDAP